MNRFVELGASVRSTSDALSSSDVGEGCLVDLEDDNSRVSSTQYVVIESDIGDFVDDGVAQGD